jgi:hypothetical protein
MPAGNVSYTYYPARKTGFLKFPAGMLPGASSRRPYNFRVKAEFGDNVEAAVRAQIAMILEVEEQPAGPTDVPPSAAVDAERSRRPPMPVDTFSPSKAWSECDRRRSGQRHHALTPRGDFSKASREELTAMHERVVAYQAGLQAFIDTHYPSADRSSADDEDAMDVDLFDGAEPRATFRPTSATSSAAVGEPECIVALQNAMIDLLDEEDLALQQETEGEEDEDAAFIPAEPAEPAATAAAAANTAAVPPPSPSPATPPPLPAPPPPAQATIHAQTGMPLESKPFEMYHQLCCTGKCVSKSGGSAASSRRCPNRAPLERRYCGWANTFPTPCPIDAHETETITYHAWQAMLRKRGEDGGADHYAEELVPIRATRAQFIAAFQGFVTTYLAHVWECRAMRQGLKMFEANKDGVTATKLTDYAAQV